MSDKPSNTEEEYFARENAERLRKLAAEQKTSLASAERESLRKQQSIEAGDRGSFEDYLARYFAT